MTRARSARLATACARILVAAFCWMTAMYGFVTSSAFAFLQFIKPRVFAWVGTFADWHVALGWVWLAMLVVVLWPRVRGRGTVAQLSRTLLIGAVGAIMSNTASPVVPGLHDGLRSLAVGVCALLPLLWLGAIDHVEAWSYLRSQDGAATEGERQQREGRVLASCAGAAVLLTAGYAVLASVSVGQAFEPDLLSAGLALGVVASVLAHALVFAAVFLVLAVLARVAGGSMVREYLLLFCAASALIAVLFARLVGDSVGLVHLPAAVAAAATGLSVLAVWGGARLGAHARHARSLTSGLDVLFSPPGHDRPERALIIALAAVLPLAWSFAFVASRVDWDFALLKSGVVIVWILTFALLYRAVPHRALTTLGVLLMCGVPLLAHMVWRPSSLQAHTLERYGVHNASFLVADALVRERVGSSPFDRYLRANTGLTDISVKPVSLDPVPSLQPTAGARPSIFLLVVDSLRADYLSPYNADVHFTPRIQQFARESAFFPNAFTRYGGTGLSMPAIWAGSALAHKQYVLPFDGMNALQKLVDTNGYRRIQTLDHITEALWTRRADDIQPDRGKNEMDFDFCATVDEIGQTLESDVANHTPVFAQTRSLNLHVAAVRNGYVPPDKSYVGFEAPYAYRVERIDSCFGEFVDRLKRLRLFENSIVVLTADHGELIGEDGRWGHSYHMFPQVVQVPLFVHLPKGQIGASYDPGAAAFSTDITPTLYAALGYEPMATDALAGHSLTATRADAVAARRRESVVLSASYGAVYAVVSQNGRRLFIADAIQEREHAYERQTLNDLRWKEVTVTDGARALARTRIRRHIDTIARTYGFERQF